MLVEHATHPDALVALTCELAQGDARWKESRQGVEGNAIADAQIAANARLRWTSRFDGDELAFPSGASMDADDARYGTRLGATDLMISLPGGMIGPFGETIEAISIPSFWLGGIDLNGDVSPTIGTVGPDGIVFTVQGRPFIYDRLGLQPALAGR
jgi:hypothetical protein